MHSLAWKLNGGEWSASLTGHFTPRERAPGTHSIRRLGGPQSCSGYDDDEKNTQPLVGIKP
jgi:hypothetical protein